MEALRNRQLRAQDRMANQSRRSTVEHENGVPPSLDGARTDNGMEQHEPPATHIPWTGMTDPFAQAGMESADGFDYGQLLDPAFNFPDFFFNSQQIGL